MVTVKEFLELYLPKLPLDIMFENWGSYETYVEYTSQT